MNRNRSRTPPIMISNDQVAHQLLPAAMQHPGKGRNTPAEIVVVDQVCWP